MPVCGWRRHLVRRRKRVERRPDLRQRRHRRFIPARALSARRSLGHAPPPKCRTQRTHGSSRCRARTFRRRSTSVRVGRLRRPARQWGSAYCRGDQARGLTDSQTHARITIHAGNEFAPNPAHSRDSRQGVLKDDTEAVTSPYSEGFLDTRGSCEASPDRLLEEGLNDEVRNSSSVANGRCQRIDLRPCDEKELRSMSRRGRRPRELPKATAMRRGISRRRSRTATPRARRSPPALAAPYKSPVSVLVVDDDRDARTIYSTFLRAVGCTVYVAADGVQAIEQATARVPSVIVLDLAMPNMDGWETAERLKRSAVTRHIPIVALTAQPGARESARISGCDAFLAKPCLPQLLWCEISILLARESSTPS